MTPPTKNDQLEHEATPDAPAPGDVDIAHEGHEAGEGHETVPAVPDGAAPLETLDRETLTAWLAGDDLTEEDQSDELDYNTALRILSAETEADALAQEDVRPIATLKDVAFCVRSVTWRKSTKSDDGKGRYAIMSCVDADGVTFLTSCGAVKVVLQLRKAQVAGWLPWTVQLSATTTSSNRTVYELVAPPAPF